MASTFDTQYEYSTIFSRAKVQFGIEKGTFKIKCMNY